MSSTPEVDIGRGVPVADGITLATDVYRPAAGKPLPVVLLRTPYDRKAHLHEALSWCRHGIGCVVQDVRGRYGSEGTFAPYRHERCDGAATVDWLTSQEWVAGIVAYGGSYAAFTAWAVAAERPTAVSRVISVVPAMGLERVKFDPSGILRLDDHTGWWVRHGDAPTSRHGLYETLLATEPELLSTLPLTSLADRLPPGLPGWQQVIDEGPRGQPPGALSDADIAAIGIPALHIGGWYDPLLRATLRHWRTAGTAVVPRPAQRLIIGPWTHLLDVAHTSDAARGRLPLGTIYLDWITDGVPADTTCARVFLRGTERWIEAPRWPNPTHERILYLERHDQLAEAPPREVGADTFRYDPADPFPSASSCGGEDPAQRGDLQRYSTPALAQCLTISGAPEVRLHVNTDQFYTDWVARLLCDDPGDRRTTLGWGCATTETPGEHSVQLELTPTSATVSPGSRLHLEITGSYFPELARSLGGPDRYHGLPTGSILQTIRRGPGADSRLHLPLADST